jgi:hypothetical protein
MRHIFFGALLLVGFQAPSYLVTTEPLDVGVRSRGLCIAVNADDPSGVWWWEPGGSGSGCSSRSTGPSVFHAERASVATRGRDVFDVSFRLQLHARPGDADYSDIRLRIEDDAMRAIRSGARVRVGRRTDLNVPEVKLSR